MTDFIINPPFFGLKNRHKPCVLMQFHPLFALKGFSKNQHQQLVWSGLSGQMAHLNTKSGEKIGLASKFLCQEENHENPVFPVATIVVDVMIE